MNHNKTLHVIAGYSAGDSLTKMLAKQNLMANHKVLVYWDDLSIGPLFSSVSSEGLKERITYLKKLYQGDPGLDNEEYYQIVEQHIRSFHDFPFADYAVIVVWHSRTASERLLFAWLCDLCQDYQGSFEMVDVKDDAFAALDYKILGLNYLKWQMLLTCYQRYRQVVPPKLVKLRAKQWRGKANSLLRICSGWEVVAVPETIFDNLILSLCDTIWQKAAQIVGKTLCCLDYPVSDFFIFYRLRTLIEQGQLIADGPENKPVNHSGDLLTMHHISIKLPREIISEKVLHVTAGCSALQTALKIQGLADSQTVIAIQDDLSLGILPLDFSVKSLKNRGDWWQSHYAADNYAADNYIDEMQNFLSTPFADYDKVVVWHGATVQDQLLLFLMCHIYDRPLHQVAVTGRMYDGVALTLSVLSPIEIIPLLSTVTAISNAQAESYRQQWQAWCQSSSTLRIMQDDKITAVAEDYFDDFVLSKCTIAWQSAARVVGYCLGYCGQYLSDDFFTRRLQHLVATGKLQAKGNTKQLRNFSIKLPGEVKCHR